MTVKTLAVERFTAFDERVTFDFCEGINLLIGANSTGKTHVMKLLYACLKASGEVNEKPSLEEKLLSVFKPDRIGGLVHRRGASNRARVKLIDERGSLAFSLTSSGQFSLDHHEINHSASVVYLPVREFLSIFPGFISAYKRREMQFDETYYDLAVALDANPLRSSILEERQNLIDPLRQAIEGQVLQERRRFYVELPEGKLEAPLVAEGYRKLAQLVYLVKNGSLEPGGTLLWDEPSSNLNPKLVTHVVKALMGLAASGIQIFIATHDYLLSQELSLLAEYRASEVPLRFFALHKPGPGIGVRVESGPTLTEIEHNAILDEFAAHYDREVSLFAAESEETTL